MQSPTFNASVVLVAHWTLRQSHRTRAELRMTMMTGQITSCGVSSRSIEGRAASIWSFLGLLRRCDSMRTAQISVAIIFPRKDFFPAYGDAATQRSRQCPTTPVTTAAAQPKFQSQELTTSTIGSLDSSQDTAQRASTTMIPPRKSLSPPRTTKSASKDTAQVPPS